MEFKYADVAQRTPEWYALRRGRVTASRLSDWLAVSKAKNSPGKPLKPRLDYEKELIYEKQFNVSYNNYVSEAMLDGVEYEDFAISEYEKVTGVSTFRCGIWYGDNFAASPDRAVYTGTGRTAANPTGIVEAKVLRDSKFMEVLLTGIPVEHWQQVQGQLKATGAKWCDYVALNLNTKRIKIIRVMPDPEFFEYLEASLDESLVTEEFSLEGVHEIGELPKWDENPTLTLSEADKAKGWL